MFGKPSSRWQLVYLAGPVSENLRGVDVGIDALMVQFFH
jgi:hypothetical protein